MHNCPAVILGLIASTSPLHLTFVVLMGDGIYVMAVVYVSVHFICIVYISCIWAFHFAPNSIFCQVFGANPVPWDVNNKTMPFSSIKNCFLGSHTRDIPNFENTSGNKKKSFILLLFYGPKGSL